MLTPGSSENVTSWRLQEACRTALHSMGADHVETNVLNQTIVDENWSLGCVAEPYCIILPNNAQDVSTAVNIIHAFDVKFAVRSGGHSPNPGWSSVGRNGILVDLQRLNEVTLSSDNSVVSIGPGARWGAVQDVLAEQNTTVMGGRYSDVGVGGLILGGGYSYLSTEYGLATDNVKDFEIVLANGTITNANANENADLFWALKGGGPNFGIVTSYHIETARSNAAWFEALIFSPDQANDVLDAFAQWQLEGGSTDTRGNVNSVMALDEIAVLLVYAGHPPDSPSEFSPFYELEPLAVLVPGTNGTIQDVETLVSSTASVVHMRHDYRSGSSRVDAQLYKDVYAFWLEKAQSVYETTGANQTFSIQHIPSSIAAHGIQKGGNPMGILQETQQWWTTLVDWVDAEDDELVRSVAIDTTAYLEELSQERGLNVSHIFMNDASRDQDPLSSYGAENLQKLKEVSMKYDPTQLFQRQQNNGFLLRNIL
ncbi:Bifunctional solanapyrone synthase [Cytospora mali]|uniref:Bifunctional solanapyrone synthase n=1 Tax=Cytospora mali TaxID=578113 RepID=A0A194V2Y7_CYTMA|nr:Bifunctional solanapyrone synthase [Valsa mali var. pyri (nom. inval.)]